MKNKSCKCLILFLFAIISCKKSNSGFYYDQTKDVYNIHLNEVINLSFLENVTTGYTNCWLNEKKCQSIKLVNREYHSDKENSKKIIIGSGGKITFSFVGDKIGTDTIKISNCSALRERKTCAHYDDKNTDTEFEIIVNVRN